MAAVKSPRQAILNRAAIALVLVITVIFLAPIYWIGSTAFKPRAYRHHGAADGLLPAGNHVVHQAFHQARAAHEAGRPSSLRRVALVRAAHLRRRRAHPQSEGPHPAVAIPEPLHQQSDRRDHQHAARRRDGHAARPTDSRASRSPAKPICFSSSFRRACCRPSSSLFRCISCTAPSA